MQFDVVEIMEWVAENMAEDHAADPAKPDINKAGIIPLFEVGDVTKILLIKPHAKKKHLGAPPWQLIKGTRMVQQKDKWEDYKQGDKLDSKAKLEPLLCTALREGMEEAGLRLDNINAIGLLGTYDYRSASSNKEKTMQLYALLIEDQEDFDWPDDAHPVTEQMQWFDIEKLPDDLREDAADIIAQVKAKL